MSNLPDREISYAQIDELLRQLEFDKQIALTKAMLNKRAYREPAYQVSDASRTEPHPSQEPMAEISKQESI